MVSTLIDPEKTGERSPNDPVSEYVRYKTELAAALEAAEKGEGYKVVSYNEHRICMPVGLDRLGELYEVFEWQLALQREAMAQQGEPYKIPLIVTYPSLDIARIAFTDLFNHNNQRPSCSD